MIPVGKTTVNRSVSVTFWIPGNVSFDPTLQKRGGKGGGNYTLIISQHYFTYNLASSSPEANGMLGLTLKSVHKKRKSTATIATTPSRSFPM